MTRAASALSLLLAVGALAAGCGSTNATASRASAPPVRPRINPARCTSEVAHEPTLPGVATAMVGVPGSPDGVAVTPDGRTSFASLQGPTGRIAVLSNGASQPALTRTIALPTTDISGLAATHHGRLLIGASGRGVALISVAGATQPGSTPLVALLQAPGGKAGGAAEVAVSPDDRFAFVSLEAAGTIEVFNLAARAFVGTIPVAAAPLGVATSPDGRWLYATSEGRGGQAEGALTTIDLRRAETDPPRSVASTAPVPCHPVRVAVSPNGRIVWVTARTGDSLLAFDAARLRAQPSHALVGAVRVGEEPIDLAVTHGGRHVIVADSNLFGRRGVTAGLTVVDTTAALRHQPGLVGAIATGTGPSEVALTPGGTTLLVNNSSSDQIEAVDVSRLP